MDKFLEMRTFAAVVNGGSFVKAADALEMPKTVVSRHVANLERRLGVRLLHRTTRKLFVTEEGQVFYRRCESVLTDLDNAESEISARSNTVKGAIKINVPLSFGLLHLAKIWPAFMAAYPDVTLDVTLTDRIVDLLEDGYDMAVRIAELRDSTLISKKLTATRLILCASPRYLKEHKTLTHPSELAQHTVFCYSLLASGDRWEFDGPEGKISVTVSPTMRSNNGDTCRAAALAGRGLILQPSFMVDEDLHRGDLVEVLPNYRAVELGIFAIYPSRQFVSPKIRALIDFISAALNNASWAVPEKGQKKWVVNSV